MILTKTCVKSKSKREKNNVDAVLEAETNRILDIVDKNIACINLKMLEFIDPPPK
jgi:hypothetical protein